MSRQAHRILIAVLATLLLAGSAEATFTVEVNPHHLRIGYGASAQLVVTARDASGAVVDGVVSWEVVPARLGSVTADGHFTAGGIGRGIVRATVTVGGETSIGHAMVTVSPLSDLPTAVLALDPPGARVDPGGSVQFHLRMTDATTGAALDGPVEWRVVPETLGRVDDTGLFVASASPGTGHVVARVNGDHRGLAEARVIVGKTGPENVQVRVRPERVLLKPGEVRRFEAVITPRAGETLDPSTVVEWSVLPPELGVISADGTLTANRETMDGRVIATVATRDGVSRGYASVAVRETNERPLAIQVHPVDAVVKPGGELRFEAIVLGPQGEIPDAPIEWSVDPAAIGTISPDGTFTAARGTGNAAEGANLAVRQGRVIARTRYQGATATGQARVVLGERVPDLWLRVLPSRATLRPGEQLQFSAELIGPSNLSSRPVDVRWSVDSDEIGSITPDGLFTASRTVGNTGSPNFGRRDGVVSASLLLPDGRVLRSTAIVLVRQPGVEERISLQPEGITLQRGESVSFRLLVAGIDANRLGYVVNWDLTPQDLGAFRSPGEFVASENTSPLASRSGRVIAHITTPDGQNFRRESVIRIATRTGEAGAEAP